MDFATRGEFYLVRKRYLAQDTKLGRKVALKLLPSIFTRDPDRLRRFEQEARTASALNHPNIVTIYEIGEVDSTHFIATEYIDGVTLRAHLATTRMKTSEAPVIRPSLVRQPKICELRS